MTVVPFEAHGLEIPAEPFGFYSRMDEEAYHAHAGSLSVSGAKTLLKAPAKFHYERTHRPHKAVWDYGHAAHKMVLGEGAEIVIVQREHRNRKGELLEVVDAEDFKSPSAREHRDRIRAEGKTPLLASDLAKVKEMALKLLQHRMAMRLLEEGEAEVSAFCEDPETGVMRRSRFDWLGPSVLSDYKSSETAEPDAFLRMAQRFGYHMQAPWYTDLAADLGHPAEAFAFIVQEKEPPYIVTVIELPPELVEIGRARNRRALEIYRECVDSDRWPGYVDDDTFATPQAPRWMLRDD